MMILTWARTAAANCKLGSKVSGTTCTNLNEFLRYGIQVLLPTTIRLCIDTYVPAAEMKV